MVERSMPKGMPLGMNWRSRPLVFSLLPHCHRAWGSQIAAVMFNQYASGRAVVGLLDQVALQVPENQAILDLLGAVLDTQLLGHETARCGRCGVAIAATGFGTIQRLDDGLFQFPIGLGIYWGCGSAREQLP